MNLRLLIVNFAIILISSSLLSAQLPYVEDTEVKPKVADKIDPEYLLIGMLDEHPSRNSVEVQDGLFASFYESQELQFQITLMLLQDLLKNRGFKSDLKVKASSNKGKAIYSPLGVQILNQYLEPISSGKGILKNGIFIKQIDNYFKFNPNLPRSRSTMLSLLTGFLLREEEDGEIHARYNTFNRKMIEFMLREGCIFDSYSIDMVGIPETVHLKLRPSKSISLALSYVKKCREANVEKLKMPNKAQ